MNAQHPFLDRSPTAHQGGISLYTLSNGSHRIGGPGEFVGEHHGSIGFPWGKTYRQAMDAAIKSVEDSAKGWLDFHANYLIGERKSLRPACFASEPCTSFVANGEAYTVYHGTHYKGSFLGFGGALVTVTLIDGKVIESNNLWNYATVPHYLSEVLKDNATLVWGLAKATGQQGGAA